MCNPSYGCKSCLSTSEILGLTLLKPIRVLCKKRKVEEVKTEKVDFKVITPPKAPVLNTVVTVNPLPSAPEQEEPAPAYTNYGNSAAV